MGYNKITPNIDKLAENGMLFRNAISNSSHTDYSLPSLFFSNRPPVNKGLISITEVLKKNGFISAAFNPNPFGIEELYGDFDKYDMIFTTRDRARISFGFFLAKIFYKRLLKNHPDFVVKLLSFIFSSKQFYIMPTAGEINEKSIHWIKKQKSNFFLWMHYMDVHEPYAPPNYKNQKELLYLLLKYQFFTNQVTSQELEKVKSLYDENIKYVDTEIGKFLEKLKEIGVYENSIIVITADHGDAFNEHGFYRHFDGVVYDELIRIPLILHGTLKKGQFERQVQLMDLAPTICDILKINPPLSFQGSSLFIPKDDLVISNAEYAISYRTKEYKLIFEKDIKKWELYDLINDPKEKINIYEDKKEIADLLLQKGLMLIWMNLKTKEEQNRLKEKINKLKFKNKI